MNTPLAKNGSSWFIRPKPNETAPVRLFCFPYAGGSAAIFREWPQRLIDADVCVANLPGHGGRRLEQPFTRLLPLARQIAEAIVPWLDKPFVFFGHSMGALISFELARQLRKTARPLPVQLFLSSRPAPHIPNSGPLRHACSDQDFIQELRRLNGTPREILNDEELLQLMIPVLKADFAICETYQYQPEPALACPITVFGGQEDNEFPRELLEAWREHTTKTFKMYLFPGDHFYLNHARGALLEKLSEELLQHQ